MRKFVLLFALAVASVSLSAQTGVQAVSVSFPEARSAKALDGRLLFLLSNDPSDEPRMQIDDTPKSQMVFGVTVDGIEAKAEREGGRFGGGISGEEAEPGAAGRLYGTGRAGCI